MQWKINKKKSFVSNKSYCSIKCPKAKTYFSFKRYLAIERNKLIPYKEISFVTKGFHLLTVEPSFLRAKGVSRIISSLSLGSAFFAARFSPGIVCAPCDCTFRVTNFRTAFAPIVRELSSSTLSHLSSREANVRPLTSTRRLLLPLSLSPRSMWHRTISPLYTFSCHASVRGRRSFRKLMRYRSGTAFFFFPPSKLLNVLFFIFELTEYRCSSTFFENSFSHYCA